MPNIELLKEKISDSGISMTNIAKKSGIERGTLYNRLSGIGEFTASEIVGLSDTLHLSKAEREDIFLKRGST
jgi:DNA-binding phage protein